MSDLDELFERSDELRSILDESSEAKLSEYINQFTADEIGNFFDMLLVMLLELDNDLPKTTKYLQVMTENCLHQLVDARTKREKKDLARKIALIMRTYFVATHRYTEAGYKVVRASQDGRHHLLDKKLAEHKHIKELADKIARNYPKLSKLDIAKHLKRKHDIKLAESTIRNIIRDREFAEDTDPFSFD